MTTTMQQVLNKSGSLGSIEKTFSVTQPPHTPSQLRRQSSTEGIVRIINRGGRLPSKSKLGVERKHSLLKPLIHDPADITYARTPEEVVSHIAQGHQVVKCPRAHIGPLEATVIAKVLRREYSSALHHLDFTGNVLGASGVRSLIEPLMVPGSAPKLAKLTLDNNKLSPEAGQWIASLLQAECCPVQNLILSRNQLGRAGGLAIAEALSVNKSIRELDLRDNCFDNHVGLKITSSMLINTERRIRKIDVSENDFPSDIVSGIEATMSFSPSVWCEQNLQEALLEASHCALVSM